LWARANGCPWEQSTTGEADLYADLLKLLKWAQATGCPENLIGFKINSSNCKESDSESEIDSECE
jgi:hypothetical protein